MDGITYHNGRYYKSKVEGLTHSDRTFSPGLLVPKASQQNSVIFIHGFRYNPFAEKLTDNPHTSTYPLWEMDIISNDSYGFGWWSCPFGTSSLWKAWGNGYWTTYGYAWKLAERAGAALRTVINLRGSSVNILCHSLGSRVVLQALKIDPKLSINKVVFMNGAALSLDALEIAFSCPNITFHNLIVRSDDVLRTFGQMFSPGGLATGTIGQAGLRNPPPNWHDIDINSKLDQMKIEDLGFSGVTGDNPGGEFDHWWTYKNPNNWPYIKHLLLSG